MNTIEEIKQEVEEDKFTVFNNDNIIKAHDIGMIHSLNIITPHLLERDKRIEELEKWLGEATELIKSHSTYDDLSNSEQEIIDEKTYNFLTQNHEKTTQ